MCVYDVWCESRSGVYMELGRVGVRERVEFVCVIAMGAFSLLFILYYIMVMFECTSF